VKQRGVRAAAAAGAAADVKLRAVDAGM